MYKYIDVSVYIYIYISARIRICYIYCLPIEKAEKSFFTNNFIFE